MVTKLFFLCAAPHFPSDSTFYSCLYSMIPFFLMAHVHWSFFMCLCFGAILWNLGTLYISHLMSPKKIRSDYSSQSGLRVKDHQASAELLVHIPTPDPLNLGSGRWQNGALRPIYKGTSRRGLRLGSSFRESSSYC